MIRIDRILQDGNGQEFLVHIEIDEGGDKFDRAISRLATKARSKPKARATALDGAVRVSVQKR